MIIVLLLGLYFLWFAYGMHDSVIYPGDVGVYFIIGWQVVAATSVLVAEKFISIPLVRWAVVVGIVVAQSLTLQISYGVAYVAWKYFGMD